MPLCPKCSFFCFCKNSCCIYWQSTAITTLLKYLAGDFARTCVSKYGHFYVTFQRFIQRLSSHWTPYLCIFPVRQHLLDFMRSKGRPHTRYSSTRLTSQHLQLRLDKRIQTGTILIWLEFSSFIECYRVNMYSSFAQLTPFAYGHFYLCRPLCRPCQIYSYNFRTHSPTTKYFPYLIILRLRTAIVSSSV